MSQPKEPSPLDDAALEEYLRGESSVSRQYRSLPDDMPPPALDRQVLAQARAALGEKAVVTRPRWVRWGAPMAVAASAVMAVSIVMQGGLQEAEVTRSVVMTEQAPAPATRQQDEAASAAVDVAPEQDVIVIEFGATHPPPPPEIATPLPVPEQPSVQSQTARQSTQEVRSAEQRERAVEKNRVLTSPASVRAEQERRVAPASGDSAETPLATQSIRRVLPAAPAAAPAPAPPPPPVVAAMPVQPEAWLSEIRRLRLDGETETADREWQRFRDAFPDYAVTDADTARPANCQGAC